MFMVCMERYHFESIVFVVCLYTVMLLFLNFLLLFRSLLSGRLTTSI